MHSFAKLIMSLIILYIARSTIRTKIKVVCCLRILPLGLSIFVDKVIYYVSMNSAGIYIFLQDYIKVLLRWKLVQLGLDDHYKRLNEVRGKDRMPHTQVTHILYTLYQYTQYQHFHITETFLTYLQMYNIRISWLWRFRRRGPEPSRRMECLIISSM